MNLFVETAGALAETGIAAKLGATQRLWAAWQAGELTADPAGAPEAPPAGRPERPVLVPPRDLPRRALNGREGHAALIHALAHIEFNAINLALDAVCRFPALPPPFHGDWLKVAAEEAEHFQLLRAHLNGLGYDYGDFPAHDGLMELARDTAHDPLIRMALVPRLMEARGLDVTPEIQKKLRGFGDEAGATILDIVLRDEVTHVAAGDRWFRHLCTERGLEPETTYRRLLDKHAAPKPRRPLNETARRQAGFSQKELDGLGH